jgi:hypothetical protein
MKKLTLLFVAIGLFSNYNSSQNANTPPDSKRKIQLAILFDTSNSMDGLLDQAKSRIWNIVNTIAKLEYDNEQPQIEIALYEYGNDGLLQKDGFVRQVSKFSTDLDEISALLFGLTTNGGSEFCGTVIHKTIQDLKWSQDTRDMKLIYIAGNEPFNQGADDYKNVCKQAAIQDIFVSSIYCGDYQKGIQEFWKDGADLGNGEYFNIDSNKKIQYIKSPYDDSIQKLNIALNNTYIGYGVKGSRKKELQESEDMNALSVAEENMVERAMSKSSSAYSNSSWDIVDFVGEDFEKLKSIDKKDLPEVMKSNTLEQNIQFVKDKKKDRETIQNDIQTLAKKRGEYIKEQSESSNTVEDDFGKAVSSSILKFANEKNYTKIER